MEQVTEPKKKHILFQDIGKEILPELLKRLRGDGVKISPEQEISLAEQIEKRGSYTPRIGFFGKTGAGKSELCNKLFGQAVAKIDDVEACTRAPSEYFIKLSGNKSICLVDVPGIGENTARQEEYKKLYQTLVSNSRPLDAILWILKADDKSYIAEEDCWKQIVQPCLKENLPVIVVLTQIDKFNPLDWNTEANEPSVAQAKAIELKLQAVAKQFEVDSGHIIAVSAYRQYNLVELVDKLISALPNETKLRVLEFTPEQNRSEQAKEEANIGWAKAILEFNKSWSWHKRLL